jgi:hypothetical protein
MKYKKAVSEDGSYFIKLSIHTGDGESENPRHYCFDCKESRHHSPYYGFLQLKNLA